MRVEHVVQDLGPGVVARAAVPCCFRRLLRRLGRAHPRLSFAAPRMSQITSVACDGSQPSSSPPK